MDKDFIIPVGENACKISIHAVPRASKTEVCGMQGNSLKLRLQAPPVDGKANKAICKYLAELFDIPARNVTIVVGDTGREKIFQATGITAVEAKEKIAAVLEKNRR